MSGIKTLRASGSQLQADVVVGANEYGSDVAVNVRLSRRDPEVEEALQPLLELLSKRAQSSLDTAAVERRVQARIREEVAGARVDARKRVGKQVDALLGEVEEMLDKATLSPAGERVLPSWQVSKLVNAVRLGRSTVVEGAA